ncbi:Metallo-dependent phosphatase-like protein [Parasitella parasitica]|nr:Metallo-dependent phosphatase-like protein [Parasitella parasitica]
MRVAAATSSRQSAYCFHILQEGRSESICDKKHDNFARRVVPICGQALFSRIKLFFLVTIIMSQQSYTSAASAPVSASAEVAAAASAEDNDTFKILIATDNHIGYLERDPIRGQDSFQTFEEILQIAEIEQVDFVLLGGDLFHHNRPTRSCLYQTMKMLRRHCFGERTSRVWISSDQSVNFADEFCKANYLDENFNVKMPVFSIHGNHDDPSGVGNLCALNLLQVSGLVNYFGASQSIEDVEIHPILMKKGNSSLALYGLGNIRDERLHRQWRSGHVNFVRGSQDCFNLFVFHQNRARHGPTSHIPEEFIDGFIDLVFWGHEHECRIGPEEYDRFHITQPGSSVATSLSEGESQPKHIGLLRIQGTEYSMESIRLKTTRPLQFTTVTLSQVQGLNRTDTKAIQTHLEGVVESLIEKARIQWEEQQQQSPYQLPLEEPEKEMPMPLVRIRVDYSGGYETFNPQQFGQKFIDRVANPKDILKFQRTQTRTSVAKPSELLSDLSTAIPERLDTLRVEDLVNELLSRDLFILPETGLEEAVMSLVEKSDKEAIRTFVAKSVAQTRATITVIPEDLSLDYVKRKSAESKENQDQPRRQDGNAVQPTQQVRGSTAQVNDSDDDLLDSITPSQSSQSQRALDPSISSEATPTTSRGRGRGARGARGPRSARGGSTRGGARGARGSSTTTSRQRKRQIIHDSEEEQISEVDDDASESTSESTSAPSTRRAKAPQRAASNTAATTSSYAISSGSESEHEIHVTNKRPALASSPSPPPSSSQPEQQSKRRRVLPGSSSSAKR